MSSELRLPAAVAAVADRMGAMPGVEAVVLGGSRASGAAGSGSDWDLGVYYRGTLDLTELRPLGEVHPPGSWGRLMNGGAWLTLEGGERQDPSGREPGTPEGERRVDVLLRDLGAVEHWTAQARRGAYEVDGLLGYLAGIPTYTLTAEVASSIVLRGELDIEATFPSALAATAPPRWRFARDFSLAHARRAAELGNEVVALGQLARAMVEEAHARLSARSEWVLNEKRILDGAGIPARLAILEGADLAQIVETIAAVLRSTG